MAKFAKLFDVADTQVLVMLSTNEEDKPCVKHITDIDGVEAEIARVFGSDDRGWEAAQAAFDAADQNSADEMHKEMVGTLKGPRLTCAACGKVTDSVQPFCEDCAVQVAG